MGVILDYLIFAQAKWHTPNRPGALHGRIHFI